MEKPQTYTVASDRLPAGRGETVTADDLPGADIRALISGGHLIADRAKTTPPPKDPKP